MGGRRRSGKRGHPSDGAELAEVFTATGIIAARTALRIEAGVPSGVVSLVGGAAHNTSADGFLLAHAEHVGDGVYHLAIEPRGDYMHGWEDRLTQDCPSTSLDCDPMRTEVRAHVPQEGSHKLPLSHAPRPCSQLGFVFMVETSDFQV